MENKRGPGRPTEKKMDTTIKLRIDRETHDMLCRYAKEKGVSMSALIRQAVYDMILGNNGNRS